MTSIKSWFTKLPTIGKIATGLMIAVALTTGSAPLAGCGSPAAYADSSKTVEIPYTTTNLKDGSQEVGQSKVKTTGVNGSRMITYRYFYECKASITRQPVNQVVLVGNKHITVATETVPFGHQSTIDNSLFEGATKTEVTGVVGVKTLTYEVSQDEGQPEAKRLIKEELTAQPINEVIGYGPACSPHYSPCIPNVSGDLNCIDIGYKTVKVLDGNDIYKLDGGSHDGYGCNSY